MDLIEVDPQLNLYDQDWPIRTLQPNLRLDSASSAKKPRRSVSSTKMSHRSTPRAVMW